MDRFLTKILKYLFFIVLIVLILVHAKAFLVPVVFAILFAMLLMPLSARFEKKGWNRGMATLFCVLFFMAVIAVFVYVLVWQISEIARNADQIQQNLQQKLDEARDYITRTFGLSREKQDEIINRQRQSGNSAMGFASAMVASLGGFLTDLVLTLVYIFLFLYYRTHLKRFVIMVSPAGEKRNAGQIMEQSRTVAQKYLTGLAIMIACLWVMYSIGFTIAGVKSPILFAVLCGLLEIVPFVGNITGTAITSMAVVMQGGTLFMVIGVLITYAIVQFLQTYILEPLVVGKGVSINPVFTIAGLVAGEFIWGIPGLILAIPIMGITKIICDHIEALKPFGYLIGSDKNADPSLVHKLRKLFRTAQS